MAGVGPVKGSLVLMFKGCTHTTILWCFFQRNKYSYVDFFFYLILTSMGPIGNGA